MARHWFSKQTAWNRPSPMLYSVSWWVFRTARPADGQAEQFNCTSYRADTQLVSGLTLKALFPMEVLSAPIRAEREEECTKAVRDPKQMCIWKTDTSQELPAGCTLKSKQLFKSTPHVHSRQSARVPAPHLVCRGFPRGCPCRA